MIRKYGSLFLLLCIFLSCLIAEDTFQTVIIPRKMCLFFNITGDITETEKLLLQESLIIQLSESADLIILEPVYFNSMTEEALNTFVKQKGGDCWLQLSIKGDTEILVINATSYDLFQNTYKIQDKVLEKDRKIRGIARGFWRAIFTDIEAGYKAIEERKQIKEIITKKQVEEIVTIQKGVNLTITGMPGTTINGLGENSVAIGEDGKAVIDLARFSTYNIRASCAGFYPVNTSIYMADKEKTINLEQIQGSNWGVDVYLQNIDYLGLGIFYYLIPNVFFLEFSSTFYQKKLIWPVSENSYLYDLPLTHLFLTFGYYLFPEDSFIRLYLSTGVFVRLIGLEELGIMIDPLSPWGLKLLSINAEIFTHYKIKPFFEYSCLFYFTESGIMMKASLTDADNSDRMVAGYFFANKMVIDILHIQVGVRIQIP